MFLRCKGSEKLALVQVFEYFFARKTKSEGIDDMYT
jgi:hypothetical protein